MRPPHLPTKLTHRTTHDHGAAGGTCSRNRCMISCCSLSPRTGSSAELLCEQQQQLHKWLPCPTGYSCVTWLCAGCGAMCLQPAVRTPAVSSCMNLYSSWYRCICLCSSLSSNVTAGCSNETKDSDKVAMRAGCTRWAGKRQPAEEAAEGTCRAVPHHNAGGSTC
jgi:hypothetical protein